MPTTKTEHILRRQSVRHLYFAKILSESEAGTVYDTPFASPWTNAVKVSPSTEATEVYSDDVLAERTTAPGDISIEITKDSDAPEVHAMLLGHKYENGEMVKNRNDVAPFFAVLYITEYSPGKYELECLYRVQFELPEKERKTAEKTPSYVQQVYKGTAYPRVDNGDWERTKDKKVGEGGVLVPLTKEDIEAWFAAVPGGSEAA